MYKCALVGCGRRAAGHAAAYQHVTRGRLVAICDPHEDRLAAFGERFGIAERYVDLREMLQREKPDLLHVVTRPDARLDILGLASEHRVPCAIVEKPIASEGEDYTALRAFLAKTRTKVCVNHQLHFHPRVGELRRSVQAGDIGEVRFVEASACLNLAYQGTHLLELISSFVGQTEPVSVFGQAAGAAGLSGDRDHYSPDQCVAAISYANGVRAQLMCGEVSPRTNDGAAHLHKRIAIYGTLGIVHWTMWSWELTLPDRTMARGKHDYFAEDVLGQAGLTEAAFDWLDDDRKVHPTNLEASLAQFNVIMGIYLSAIRHAPVPLPAPAEPNLIGRLRSSLVPA